MLLRGSKPKGKGLFCGFWCGRVSQELVYNFHSKACLHCSHKEVHTKASHNSPCPKFPHSAWPVLLTSGSPWLETTTRNIQLEVFLPYFCLGKDCAMSHAPFSLGQGIIFLRGTLQNSSTQCVCTAQLLV